MLHAVSWATFFRVTILFYSIYYSILALLFHRRQIFAFIRHRQKTLLVALPVTLLLHFAAHAQTADGNNGLSQANTMIRSYFDNGVQILYAVGALVALVGAGIIYSHWNSHNRQEIAKEAAGWFGSCIFLVIVATVIKSFFGL
jgi:hypothetical protein